MKDINNIGQHQRNTSIELLRIISMIMIVACHFATHGGFSFDTQLITIPRLWWNFLEMGGNFGVDVFVLISGYFLSAKDVTKPRCEKILKLWGTVFFYSASIYLAYCIVTDGKIDAISFIKNVLPITFGAWWFASTYFVLFLISPFINMFLQRIDRNEYRLLIMTELILWCLIPSCTSSSFQSNHLIWFITLYCVGGYIKQYGIDYDVSSSKYALFWIFFSFLRYSSSVVLILLGTKFRFAADNSLFFYEQQSILTFLSALSLFMAFEKKRMHYNKHINTVASATFGVYLIHDNNFVRYFLWIVLFRNQKYQNSILLIPYSLIVVIVVFSGCLLIELFRQRTVEKVYMKIVNTFLERNKKVL